MAKVLAVRTRELTKQFDRHMALHRVDLHIQSGEVYGLIGPNGAGKTTLLRLLASVDEPTSGEIFLHGDRLLRHKPNPKLKSYLGFLPDDFPLYDGLSVWDYLDYFARLYGLREPRRRQRLQEVLELVQLTQKRDSLIATLSRGMRQRLGLARTIIHEPSLLLLDEPVSGLDPIARMQFRQIIKTLQQNHITIIISSHVLSDLAELCTSIGILEQGRLVESSSLKTLYDRLSQQQIIITGLNGSEALQTALRDHPHVSHLELLPNSDPNSDPKSSTIRIQFSGTQQDAAKLLRSLIRSGIAISDFHRTQDNLETIFLKLGHQQTS